MRDEVSKRQIERTVLVFIILVVAGALAASAQDGPRPMQARAAATAIAADLEIENTMLLEDLERYDRVVRKRNLAANRATELLRSLDTAVRGDTGASPEQIDVLLEQLSEAEGERAELMDEAIALIGKIRDRRHRSSLLVEKLNALEGLGAEAAGALSGTWDVVLLPLEQRGVAILLQTGTLVGGTYQLDGGWTGSLQGTLVNRKVFLVRIDSQLGRMMELEGFLSSEGDRIRGTWLNHELAGGEAATGHWSAEKRETEP